MRRDTPGRSLIGGNRKARGGDMLAEDRHVGADHLAARRNSRRIVGRITWTDEVAAVAVSLPYSDISLSTLSTDELARLRTLIEDLREDSGFMTPHLDSRFQRLLPLVEEQLRHSAA
jgi:hypothetical protein